MNSDKGELMRRINKPVAAIAAAALVLGTAGVAFAYWTTTGTGSGTGSTTAGVEDQLSFTQNPDVDGDATALAPMYPGDSAQSLAVVVENTSGESAYVAQVVAYITTSAGDDCDGSDFLLGDGTATDTPSTSSAASPVLLDWSAQDLAAAGSDSATGDVQFNNTGSNQDGCKDVTVTVHYVAS